MEPLPQRQRRRRSSTSRAIAEGSENLHEDVGPSDAAETSIDALDESYRESSTVAVAETLQELQNLGLEQLQALQRAIEERLALVASRAATTSAAPSGLLAEQQQHQHADTVVMVPEDDLQQLPVDEMDFPLIAEVSQYAPGTPHFLFSSLSVLLGLIVATCMKQELLSLPKVNGFKASESRMLCESGFLQFYTYRN